MKTRVPLIAIVGRPNVGKSTLFNRWVGERRAIVEDEPGVTRDRQYAVCLQQGRTLQLIDTGGFDPDERSGMLALMRDQASMAIEEADAIVWVCDAHEGITPADSEIGSVLRQTSKPVYCAANKCDVESHDVAAMELYGLGVDRVYPISAEHNRGLLDLLDDLIEALDASGGFGANDQEDDEQELSEEAQRLVRGGVVDRVRVCVIGRPNVGKSTLINALLGDERMLISDVPGTTRDAIDVDFEHEGGSYTLIDTAGMRRRPRITHSVEIYSVSRAVRALERSHVALLVLDTTQEIADQDARIATLIERRGRACVVVCNKWDAIEKDTGTMAAYEKDLRERLPFLAHAPMIFVSALTGRRVHKVMDTMKGAYASFNQWIGTGELNRWLEKVQLHRQPPVWRGKRLKIYFGAQVGVRPPTFALQVNSERAISEHYRRFLVNRLRTDFGFEGAPIRLRVKGKGARKTKRASTASYEVEMAEMVKLIDLDDAPDIDIEGMSDEALEARLDDVFSEDWTEADEPDEDEEIQI